MTIFYDFLYAIFALIYFPFLIVRGKFHKDFSVRFGIFPLDLQGLIKNKKNIWIHAVSVGEILAIVGLIDKLKAISSQYQIVCSTVTATGYTLAQEKLKDKAIVVYAPLDFSGVVERYVRLIKPRLYIAAETEIWPNLYRALNKSQIPIAMINGRISDQSFGGYQLVPLFIKNTLRHVTIFCMQTESDAERIVALGADPQKVQTLGNLKFDNATPQISVKLEDWGYDPGAWLLIAGSTHPGEEKILLEGYERLRGQFPQLRLVIAPRHIERSSQIIRLIEAKGFQAKRFSEFPVAAGNSAKTIVVVDTIGHLRTLYSLATIVFVGKSLTGKGGQNIIEPASLGKAIIVGPHTENFKDVVRIFLENKALVQVQSSEEFFRELKDVLENSERREQLARQAKQVVEKNQGTTERIVEALKGLL